MDDFGLRRVAIHAEHNGQPLDLHSHDLDRPPGEPAYSKPYDTEYDFKPAALGLHNGDVVNYWAEAEDNKEPKPNHVETEHRTIRIVDDQNAGQGQQNPEQQGGGQGTPSDKTQPGGKGKSNDQHGESGKGDESGDGSAKNGSSADGKGGHDDQENKPRDPQGAKSNPDKSNKDQGGKGEESSDSNNGDRGENGSSERW